MKRTLADLAQDVYVKSRVKAKTDPDTRLIEIPSLPPFSLGVKHKKERKKSSGRASGNKRALSDGPDSLPTASRRPDPSRFLS